LKTRIVVTRRIPEPALDLLRRAGHVWLSPHERRLTPEELQEAVAGADALVTLLDDRVDNALLNAAGPQLKVVANVAVGFDNIDVPACAARGILVTNTPGVLTEATADIAFALILLATRRLGEGERHIRASRPWSWDMFFMLGSGIQDKALGIIGLGQIGQATARRAKAFSMNIVYTGRRRAPQEIEHGLGARFLQLDELLQCSDVVSLHCPLSPETRHLITAKKLSLMKPTAFLVNTTRGPVLDESALVDALRGRVIAGAGLDVYEHEPQVHPGLLEFENVVLLPHLGSATVETRTTMAIVAAHNVSAVLKGEQPTNRVDVQSTP
jgi:glyoxylate reductase